MTGKTRPLKVSPSSLNLLRECARCFWLQLKKETRRPRSPFPSLPSALDRLAKAACKPYHGADVLPPFLKGTGLEGRLVDPHLKAWQEPDTGLVVSGFLDECLEVPGRGFAPLDHKTRGSRTERINASYYVQLDIYALMLQGNGRQLLGEGILVYFIPEFDVETPWDPVHPLPFSVDLRRVRTSVRRAIELVRQARNVLDMAEAPDASERCEHCRWAAQAAEAMGNGAAQLEFPTVESGG